MSLEKDPNRRATKEEVLKFLNDLGMKKMNPSESMKWNCPWCGKRHEAKSFIADDNSKSSDKVGPTQLTICSDCGVLSVIDMDRPPGLARPATPGERAILRANPKYRALSDVIASAARTRAALAERDKHKNTEKE